MLKTSFLIVLLTCGLAFSQGQQPAEWSVVPASEAFSFELSPNPLTQNPLYINSSRTEVKEIHIYNAIGHLVYSEKTTGSKIYLNHLQKGIYIVTLQQGTSQASRRLIIP